MQELNDNPDHQRRQRRRIQSAFVTFLVAIALFPAACSEKSAPQPQAQAKRYQLVGKVVSIDKDQASVMVDGKEIVGFMGAMAMAYPVRDAKALAALNPGDEITADVVVADDGAYLENIVVTKKGRRQGPHGNLESAEARRQSSRLRHGQSGRQANSSQRVSGRRPARHVHLHALPISRLSARSSPGISRRFTRRCGRIRRSVPRIRLLSVSFDPDHDTPAVLRQYADTFRATTGGDPFDRWQFAAVPPKELVKRRKLFRLVLRHRRAIRSSIQ